MQPTWIFKFFLPLFFAITGTMTVLLSTHTLQGLGLILFAIFLDSYVCNWDSDEQ